MTDISTATKILFFDIDGVINSDRTAVAFGARPHCFEGKDLTQFDWVAVGLIRALCRITGAAIVLSSSWRYHHTAEEVGLALDLNIIDRTPEDGQSRGAEIEAWLKSHPHVRQYAIVDDINAFLPEQQKYFVQTKDEEGFSFSDYKKLKALLK